MGKCFPKPVTFYIIGHIICRSPDLRASVSHSYTDPAVFQHGNIYLCVSESHRSIRRSMQMFQQNIHGICLVNLFQSQISEQRRFSRAAPGSRFQFRKRFCRALRDMAVS